MSLSAHNSILEYRLWILARVRDCRVDTVPILDLTEGGYNVWQRFEQYIFSVDLARFSQTGSFDSYARGEGGVLKANAYKGILVGILSIIYTLVSVFFMALRGARVIVFGIDRISDPIYKADFRMHFIYKYLRGQRVEYFEILHTLFNRDFVHRLFIRLRPVAYLEAPDTVYAIGRLLGFFKSPAITIETPPGLNSDEDRFIRYVIKKYLAQRITSHLRVRMLEYILRITRARVVTAIDDARTFHDLAIAAQRVGIPMIAFQHGHFTKYHIGWLAPRAWRGKIPRPDILVVWSEYWRHELARLKSIFSDDQLMVGTLNMHQHVHARALHTQIVLIPHETDSPKADIAKSIVTLVNAGFHVVLKLRPDASRASQLAQYPELPHSPAFRTIVHLKELTEAPGCAIGVYSSFLYEMIAHGVPVGVLSDLSPYGLGMIENGLANKIRIDALVEDTRTLLNTASEELGRRHAVLTEGQVPIESVLADIMHKAHISV